MPDQPSDGAFPDVFSDSISVAAGPYGFTLSFLLTDPLRPVAEGDLPGRVVARVRLSRELVDALVTILSRSVKNIPSPQLSFPDNEQKDKEG
ncbi:MAG: hypothetical protein ABI744_04045 [Chloroflexota bacterium]